MSPAGPAAQVVDRRSQPAPDPQQLVQRLRGADFSGALGDVIGVLEQDHEQRFAAAVSPEGEPWPELRPSTIAKKGHAVILREHDYLIDSETSSSAPHAIREIVDNGEQKELHFGTSRPFAGVHQHGSDDGRIPQRKHLGASEAAKEQIKHIIAARVREVLTGTA